MRKFARVIAPALFAVGWLMAVGCGPRAATSGPAGGPAAQAPTAAPLSKDPESKTTPEVPVKDAKADQKASEAKHKEKGPSEDVKITAEALMNELVGNDQAVAKYKGKTLLVEGVVLEVNKEAELVFLKGTNITNVVCEFPSSRKGQLAMCKVGEKVSIRGKFTLKNATGHAVLDKCEVAK